MVQFSIEKQKQKKPSKLTLHHAETSDIKLI